MHPAVWWNALLCSKWLLNQVKVNLIGKKASSERSAMDGDSGGRMAFCRVR